MNNYINFITDALEYYDSNIERHDNILNSVRYIKLINTDDQLENNKIALYDYNNKLIKEVHYEILGRTENDNSWKWAWSISTNPKNKILSNKVLKYFTDINNFEFNTLKKDIISWENQIKNKIQLDIYIAVSAYLSKKPIIFKLPLEKNNELIINKNIELTENPDRVYYLFLLDFNN